MEELNQLRDISMCIDYSKDRIQESKVADEKMVNQVNKIIELEKSIKKQIDKMIDLRIDIRDKIDNVENVDEKLLLKLKYLNFYSFEEISEEMNLSLSTIHRIHSNALRNIKIDTK